VGVQRPFCLLQFSVNQYDIGHGQGSAAVDWIKAHLGGQAQVVYFNNDKLDPLIPRHHGVLDALKKGGPGIKVASDITAPATTDAAASQMTAILQAHPDVKVVLGDAPTIEGAFAAFKALNRAHDPDVYISSCAGTDPDYELIKAGTIYKATSAEPWNGWAYCIGQFAADWFEGKSIPRGISARGCSEPMLTSPGAVTQFQRYMDDPRGLWANKSALAKYISFFGNVSYSTKENWWRKAWTP
jgi:ribose transport system substrate-binding protein